MADSTPLYNLKAVSNEVGLNPATLRAWERRYGLLKPKRSPGGHRLYSRQDIEMLKWLVDRQKEGLSISRAIELWNRMQENELAASGQIPISEHIPTGGEAILEELRQKWLQACLAYDDISANHLLDQAFSRVAPETVCLEVLQKGLAEIGEGWYKGSASVQQEHFASSIASRRIDSLLAATIEPTRSETILVACPPGDEHIFPLLLVTYLLRRRGWNVVYLGADVPLENLDDAMESTSPACVVSAAQTLISAASLRNMSESVTGNGVLFAYGGRVFNENPATREAISGHFLGSELAGVPQAMEILLSSARALVSAPPVPAEYEQALDHFLKNEAFIAAYVASMIPSELVEPGVVQMANTFLGRLIPAALTLGDTSHLDTSSAWLRSLLGNRGLSAKLASQFFATYLLAAKHYLGHEDGLVQRWLRQQVTEG